MWHSIDEALPDRGLVLCAVGGQEVQHLSETSVIELRIQEEIRQFNNRFVIAVAVSAP